MGSQQRTSTGTSPVPPANKDAKQKFLIFLFMGLPIPDWGGKARLQ